MKRDNSREKWEGAGKHSIYRKDGAFEDIGDSFALLFMVLGPKSLC